ncbi:hypothetical protein D3C78_1350150 [compost metagenome]
MVQNTARGGVCLKFRAVFDLQQKVILTEREHAPGGEIDVLPSSLYEDIAIMLFGPKQIVTRELDCSILSGSVFDPTGDLVSKYEAVNRIRHELHNPMRQLLAFLAAHAACKADVD